MSRNKRRRSDDSDSEIDNFYNDHIDLNDSFLLDDEPENENEDPLASDEDIGELDSQFDEFKENDDDNCDLDSEFSEDPLESDEEDNCDLDSEFSEDPLESDEEDFDFDYEGDSDDESDFSASSEDESSDSDIENDPLVLNAKDRQSKVEWKSVPANFVPRMEIPVYKEPEMSVDEDSTPVDLFFKLFPKRLFEWIAKCTNERLDILAEKKGIEVQHTDGDEMILVIGCLLVMGFNRLPQMQMYWSNNPTLGNKTIKNAITRDRFLQLASKLYFNHPIKPKGADKTYYINKLVKYLKYTFKRARSESTFQSIDETMVKFKGRWSGKQYMPKKKEKVGAKIWSRSDAMSGYCYDLNVYAGQEEEPTEGTLGERVVIKLSSTIGDEDVVICTDRFFTSYELMKNLPFACVGTVMKNRKNIPIIKEKLKKGESVSKSTADGVIAFKWQDSKEVMLLSNCHSYDISTVERKQKDGSKKTVSCPEAIAFYNKYMGGVDMTDQYTVLYDINRKSNKWWKRVFQRLLMTAVTNAWVLYKQLKNKKIPLIDMLVPLAENLIEIGKAGSRIQRSCKNGRPSKKSKTFVNVQHLPAPSTKRRCIQCSSKNMQKRTKFVCSTCDVPLCAGCFLPYHQ